VNGGTPIGLGPQGGDHDDLAPPVQADLSTCIWRAGPPPVALEAVRALAPEHLQRHPYRAAAIATEAYAAAVGVPSSELVVGRGISDLLWALADGPLGGRVVVPWPAYTEYVTAFPNAGHGAPAWGYDLDAVAALLDAGAVVLVSNPHNPSGRVVDRATLGALLDGRPGVLVVDESYVEFCEEPARSSLLGIEAGNVVVLRSPSKFFGLAGARVGFAWAADPVLRAACTPRRGPWPLSMPDVVAAVAALGDPAWIHANHIAVRAAAAALDDLVGPLGEPVSGSAIHIRLVPAPDAVRVASVLRSHGVAVRVLGAAHGLPAPAVRFAAPLPEEVQFVVEAVDAVVRARAQRS